MFSYTTTTLKKMEVLLEALDYTLRYEKGNFQSGYCLLKDRQVAVVSLRRDRADIICESA